MRRKTALAGLIFAAALSTTSPDYVSATSTSSIRCTKIGATRTLRSIQQKCTKVGSVRKWVTVTNSKNKGITSTTVAPWKDAQTTTVSSDRCKLPDRRDASLINTPRSLGFPLNQTGSLATGRVNLVLVAADFPNFQGTAPEIAMLGEQVKKFNEWLAFQSNGKLTANWQFPSKFIRLPRNAADYGVVGFTPSTHTAIVSDIVTGADSDVNFSAVDEMFVYMPDSLTLSEPGKNPFDGILSQFGGTNVTTSEGVIKHVKGSGTVSKQERYGTRPTLWALWAHDLLHTIGVEGHNPVESFTLESEDYLNHVVSAWNQWLLGWMNTDQIACLDKAAVNGMEVDLVPLQNADPGFRTAIVPLTDTRALVVESHRNKGYGENLGGSGILVYLMDTKNVPPYEQRESTALIGSKFIDPNTVLTNSRPRIGNGRRSALMQTGEYAQFEDLRVTFIRSASKDKIQFSIEK
jgi:M6 family metalloprotease-like protein